MPARVRVDMAAVKAREDDVVRASHEGVAKRLREKCASFAAAISDRGRADEGAATTERLLGAVLLGIEADELIQSLPDVMYAGVPQ